jgi:hypothetical protein
MRLKKSVSIALLCFLLAGVLPPLSGYLVYREIQHRMKLKIAGDFSPAFHFPGFYLRNAHFQWEDRVELLSGNMTVQYDPLSLLRGELLRIVISSRGAAIRLTGAWEKMQGVNNAVIDVFDCDLGLGRKGIREIYGLELRSPAFQFHVKKSDK